MASTNKTSKGLSQFLGTDRLQREDYNNDMGKIDNELKELDQNKEPKITKKSGFNKEKTDSVTTNSSVILATAKAIKTVWDALTSHRNSTSNPHIVTKNQVGLGNVPNYTMTDSTTDGSSLKFGSAKAIKTVWNKALEILGLTNTNKNAILNAQEQIENLSYVEGGNSDTGFYRKWNNGRLEIFGTIPTGISDNKGVVIRIHPIPFVSSSWRRNVLLGTRRDIDFQSAIVHSTVMGSHNDKIIIRYIMVV